MSLFFNLWSIVLMFNDELINCHIYCFKKSWSNSRLSNINVVVIDLNFCLSSSLFFRLFFKNLKLFQVITIPSVLFINLMIDRALFVKSFIHRCIIKYDITRPSLHKVLKTRFLISSWYKYKFISVWKFVDQFDHIKLHKMSNKTKWNSMTSESENFNKTKKYFLIIEFKNLNHKNVMKIICFKFNNILFNVSNLMVFESFQINCVYSKFLFPILVLLLSQIFFIFEEKWFSAQHQTE